MTPEQPSKPRRFRKWIGRLALVNLVVVVGVTVWFYLAADENWLATLLLFGPRWLAFAPLVLLLPLTLLSRSWRGLAWCVIAAIVIAGPFTGVTVNVASELGPVKAPGTVRVMTFNADAKSANRELFHAFVTQYQPDVICLQDADRILAADFPAEYRFVPASNGLAMASRNPLKLTGTLSDTKIGPARGAARYTVNFGPVERDVVTLHLPTPRAALEGVLARKPNAVADLEAMIAQRSAASAVAAEWVGTASIVAGDFNMPVESTIYRRDWSKFHNAYSDAGLGWGWTMFTRREFVRIDQILYGEPFKARSVLVGPDLGSAHRPLLADFTP